MIPLPPEIPTIILSFLFSGKPVKFIIRLKIIFCFLFLLGNHERVSHPTRHFSFYRPEDSDEILKHFCKLSAFNQKTNVHSIVSSVIRLHFRDQKLLRINRNDLNRDHRWNESEAILERRIKPFAVVRITIFLSLVENSSLILSFTRDLGEYLRIVELNECARLTYSIERCITSSSLSASRPCFTLRSSLSIRGMRTSFGDRVR